MNFVLVFVVIAAVIIVYMIMAQSGRPGDIEHMTVEEFRTKLAADSNLVLLDVRTRQEFDGPLGRLEGAVLMPLNELETRLEELDSLKDREIVVYCRSGNRSRYGTRILQQNGYRAVNLAGGMLAWNASRRSERE